MAGFRKNFKIEVAGFLKFQILAKHNSKHIIWKNPFLCKPSFAHNFIWKNKFKKNEFNFISFHFMSK